MNKIYLVDLDGTTCDDIKNEDSHLYPTAKQLPHSKEVLNKWYDEGNTITFFTARVEEDRGVTEQWLKDNGYKYHGLIMNKPRIKDGQEYIWIDNRPVSGIVYKDNWLGIGKKNLFEIIDYKYLLIVTYFIFGLSLGWFFLLYIFRI